MSNTFTEGTHPGEFIVSEANAGGTGVSRSRDTITVALASVLVAGAVLGTVTASGEFAEYDPAAIDGTESVSGILFDHVDATAAAVEAVGLVRDCEVNADEIVWKSGLTAGELVTAGAELTALGIIQRVAG